MRKVVIAGGLVYKSPAEKPPKSVHSLYQVYEMKEKLSPEQYDGMYQTLYEVELWDSLSWEQRLIFCPIINYDSASCVSTMVYVEPLMDEATAKTISDEESLKVMTDILLKRGACLGEICLFIKILKKVCKETDLVRSEEHTSELQSLC